MVRVQVCVCGGTCGAWFVDLGDQVGGGGRVQYVVCRQGLGCRGGRGSVVCRMGVLFPGWGVVIWDAG